MVVSLKSIHAVKSLMKLFFPLPLVFYYFFRFIKQLITVTSRDVALFLIQTSSKGKYGSSHLAAFFVFHLFL